MDTPAAKRRRLGWAGLLGLLVVWLVVPPIVVRFAFSADLVSSGYQTARSTIASEAAVDVIAILLVGAVIWRLGWWRRVWTEPRRVRPWVAVVPVLLVLCSAAVTDYGNLASLSVPLVLAFTVSMVTTGVGEELLFRGVVLSFLRERLREGWAVLVMCLMFGALHLVNLAAGAGALGQALVAAPAGYLLYLCRRVGGGLLLPIVVHAAIDFAAFSSDVGQVSPQASDAAFYQSLVMFALIVLLLAGRRRIGLPGNDSAGSGSPISGPSTP
jgi:membrane protease YdiL (CAAX protease family)